MRSNDPMSRIEEGAIQTHRKERHAPWRLINLTTGEMIEFDKFSDCFPGKNSPLEVEVGDIYRKRRLMNKLNTIKPTLEVLVSANPDNLIYKRALDRIRNLEITLQRVIAASDYKVSSSIKTMCREALDE